jgi:hypothetical protein
MNRFWIIIRFIIFMPVAALLVCGYALAGALDLFVFSQEGRDTIRRFWMSWWHWVSGEMSTYDLIK